MESLYLKIYYIVVILNYFNSLVNPIIYALRIPDFKQHLTVCCSLHRVVDEMRSKYAGRSNDRIAASRLLVMWHHFPPIWVICSLLPNKTNKSLMTLNCEIVVQIIVLYEPSVIKFEVLFLYQNTLCNNIVVFSVMTGLYWISIFYFNSTWLGFLSSPKSFIMKTCGSLSILVPKVLTSTRPCMNSPIIGPLQLVIPVVQNCHAGE